jgi:hypothetical protein
MWSAHLRDKQDKLKFETELRSYLVNAYFSRLREILRARKENLLHVSDPDYDNPSWSHRQAHMNGKVEELDFILEMIHDGTNQRES